MDDISEINKKLEEFEWRVTKIDIESKDINNINRILNDVIPQLEKEISIFSQNLENELKKHPLNRDVRESIESRIRDLFENLAYLRNKLSRAITQPQQPSPPAQPESVNKIQEKIDKLDNDIKDINMEAESEEVLPEYVLRRINEVKNEINELWEDIEAQKSLGKLNFNEAMEMLSKLFEKNKGYYARLDEISRKVRSQQPAAPAELPAEQSLEGESSLPPGIKVVLNSLGNEVSAIEKAAEEEEKPEVLQQKAQELWNKINYYCNVYGKNEEALKILHQYEDRLNDVTSKIPYTQPLAAFQPKSRNPFKRFYNWAMKKEVGPRSPLLKEKPVFKAAMPRTDFFLRHIKSNMIIAAILIFIAIVAGGMGFLWGALAAVFFAIYVLLPSESKLLRAMRNFSSVKDALETAKMLCETGTPEGVEQAKEILEHFGIENAKALTAAWVKEARESVGMEIERRGGGKKETEIPEHVKNLIKGQLRVGESEELIKNVLCRIGYTKKGAEEVFKKVKEEWEATEKS